MKQDHDVDLDGLTWDDLETLIRKVIREELRDMVPASTQEAVPVVDAAVVGKVRDVFHASVKPGQAQSVTWLAKFLGLLPEQAKAALKVLENAGEIYARPHMRGWLYYLTGQGPGPVKSRSAKAPR